MRKRVEPVIRRFWEGDSGLPGVLLRIATQAPAVLYGAAVRGRNLLFDHGVLEASDGGIPVVSIGNLTVGGTGKTPVTRWIVSRLAATGRLPAVVTRGYGSDEVALHRRWHPDVPVMVARNRVEGVRRAAEAGANVAVVDDAFQHRRLYRDLDVLLISAHDPLPPRVLPRGPYREPFSSRKRADLVLVTSTTAAAARKAAELVRAAGVGAGSSPVYPFPFGAGRWADLEGRPVDVPKREVTLLTSVARPNAVRDLLGEEGVLVATALIFPDHHEYTSADVHEIRARAGVGPIVTTEKDAVKLSAFHDALRDVRVLALRPRPEPAVERALDEALRATCSPGAVGEP